MVLFPKVGTTVCQETRVSLRTAVRFMVVPAAALVCLVPATAQAAPVPKVTVSKVTVKGAKVTVTGSVRLPRDTATARRRTRVALTLANAKGRKEAFSLGLDARRRFRAVKTTKLTGALGLSVVVKIGGRASGRRIVKTVSVAASKTGQTTVAGAGAGGGPAGGAAAPGGGTTAPGAAPPVATGTPLVGLLKLDEGRQAISGALSGTYFRMLGIINGNSTALNPEYTLLRPGTDGGLRTDGYQGPPAPAFSGTDPISGAPSGNALAGARPAFGAARGVAPDQEARGADGAACRRARDGDGEIEICRTCGNIDTQNPCTICTDPRRDASAIVVVADVADLWALERAHALNARYHVLGGTLSPLDGVGPDDLSIDALIKRAHDPAVKELILALNATVDGQSTAHYITDLLHDRDMKVTRLAHGVPVGGELDYLDEGTLAAAIRSRTPF